ncbi:hypothetical protein HDA32_003133 [Spinactinospora alkalitolerans]|uniref:Condensation domain-containing protein n=1 Tax=Spinactinospora alkalitolerans TaxID=687207 RepID=A0A852TYZ3_9ACTN|nr:condensation domain-containing protein [Spinactinospora alkalitolerans]NYE48013.1 hypothetical protein [Spinactinospora alkalitolerans]
MDDTMPLSCAQRGLWYLHHLEEPTTAYNVPLHVRLSGRLDRRALAFALSDVVGRHEPLRTVYPTVRGDPRQRVLEEERLPSLLSIDDRPETAGDRLSQAERHHFDLSTEPPIRGHLHRLGADEHMLLLVMHHIAVDGWSCPILLRDLGIAYTARLNGTPPAWPPLRTSYGEYARRQQELLADAEKPGRGLAAQLEHWRGTLAGLPEELELPFDRDRPVLPSHNSGTVSLHITPELHRRLLRTARRNRCTLFMGLQAGTAALFTRCGAGTDIPIGVPTVGRTETDLEDLVGLFVNPLVLRFDTSGDPSFKELLMRVRSTSLDAYANWDLPFEYLVARLNPRRSPAHHPLFQTMLAFNNDLGTGHQFPGLSVEAALADPGTAKFDLDVGFSEKRTGTGETAGVTGSLQYSRDLFDHGTAQWLAAGLVGLLDSASRNPERPISAIVED